MMELIKKYLLKIIEDIDEEIVRIKNKIHRASKR